MKKSDTSSGLITIVLIIGLIIVFIKYFLLIGFLILAIYLVFSKKTREKVVNKFNIKNKTYKILSCILLISSIGITAQVISQDYKNKQEEKEKQIQEEKSKEEQKRKEQEEKQKQEFLTEKDKIKNQIKNDDSITDEQKQSLYNDLEKIEEKEKLKEIQNKINSIKEENKRKENQNSERLEVSTTTESNIASNSNTQGIVQSNNGTEIRGNSKSRIYHTPGQRDYEKMGSSKHLVRFSSVTEAENSGYRAAKR